MNGITTAFNRNSRILTSFLWPAVFWGFFCIGTLAVPANVEALDLKTAFVLLTSRIDPPSLAGEAAKLEMNKLPNIVGRNNNLAKRLGFDSAADVAVASSLSLALPLPVFYVGLQALQEFSPPPSPPLLLPTADFAIALLSEDANWSQSASGFFPVRFIFPIKTSSIRPATSVFVVFFPDSSKWEVQRLGSPRLIRALTNSQLRNGPKDFAVRIPALNRWYLGWMDGAKFWIRAIFDDKAINLSKGEKRLAKDVFLALKREAMAIERNNPAPR